MGTDTLFVILLAWSVTGLLVAIAFGKAIREASPDEEQSLASSSAGTVNYIRRNKVKVRDASVRVSGSRRGAKRASG